MGLRPNQPESLNFRGPVAQLGARIAGSDEVGSSSLPRSTKVWSHGIVVITYPCHGQNASSILAGTAKDAGGNATQQGVMWKWGDWPTHSSVGHNLTSAKASAWFGRRASLIRATKRPALRCANRISVLMPAVDAFFDTEGAAGPTPAGRTRIDAKSAAPETGDMPPRVRVDSPESRDWRQLQPARKHDSGGV